MDQISLAVKGRRSIESVPDSLPVQSRALSGLDSLLSIAQMPAGIPVGTLAIGVAGAKNAALLAARMLATSTPELRSRLQARSEREGRDAVAAELR